MARAQTILNDTNERKSTMTPNVTPVKRLAALPPSTPIPTPSFSPEIEKLAQDAVVPRRIACPRHLHVLLWER